MKNTIIVLTVLLLSNPVLAQNDLSVVYPSLDSFLQSEKNNHGLLSCINKEQPDYKRFIELYNQQNHVGKKPIARPVTFLDGPVVYSASLHHEIRRDANTLYQRYSAASTEPSAALQLLGFAAGIAASAFYPNKYNGNYYPSYTGSTDRTRYLDNRAAIEAAYLQLTNHQHDK